MDLAKPLVVAVMGIAALVAAQDTCVSPTIRLKLSSCSIPGTGTATDVSAWGLLAGVGDSAKLCMVPSTVVNSTILMSNEICEDPWLHGSPNLTLAQCRSRRGGFIQRSDFSSADITSPTEMERLKALNPGWKKLMSLSGINDTFQHALQTDLHLSPTRKVTMVQGLATGGQQSSLSHLGLGEQSELLGALKKAELIGARSWGLDSGSQSVLHPRDGSLILGGFDQGAYTGSLWDFATHENETNELQDRPCPLQVTVSKLVINVNNANNADSKTYEDTTNPSKYCIEPYDNAIRFSPDKVTDIIRMANLTLVDNSSYPTLYNMEPGLVFASRHGSLNITMDITLDNGFQVTIPSYELLRPLRGLDSTTGALTVNENYDEIAVYRVDSSGTNKDKFGSPVGNSAVFGKVFLSQVYLYVNYETHKFSLGSQNQGGFSSAVEPSAPCQPEEEQRGLTGTDKGLIGGIAGLGALVLVISVALGFFVWKKWIGPPKAETAIEPGDRGAPGSGHDPVIRPPSEDD